MYRCLHLAKLGAGQVAPNPMVGAVLVHDDRIIGEGYHQKYGEAHAEVNAIHQAASSGQMDGQTDMISQSTLYVSLEPCSHFGKTPPCADLIIKHKIPKVIIGCRDPFKEVNGKGIEKLKAAGIETEVGILENECKDLNKRFFVFHTQHRPYIILKWAETADGFIASPLGEGEIVENSAKRRLLISNEYTNRIVHKWRSEEAAILVGTNTVENDDPVLTTRLWPGNNPIRLVVDLNLRLPSESKVFNQAGSTIIFNTKTHSEESKWSLPSPPAPSPSPSPLVERAGVRHYQVTNDVSLVHQVVNALYQLKIQSVIVEGGARLLQSFIDEEMWDQATVICNTQLATGGGLHAPELKTASLQSEQAIFSDVIRTYKHLEN